jgi:hypothetical protein
MSTELKNINALTEEELLLNITNLLKKSKENNHQKWQSK